MYIKARLSPTLAHPPSSTVLLSCSLPLPCPLCVAPSRTHPSVPLLIPHTAPAVLSTMPAVLRAAMDIDGLLGQMCPTAESSQT